MPAPLRGLRKVKYVEVTKDLVLGGLSVPECTPNLKLGSSQADGTDLRSVLSVCGINNRSHPAVHTHCT